MRVRNERAPLSAQAALAAILLCTVLIMVCIGAVSWLLLQQAATAVPPLPATPLACALVVPALPVRNPLRRWWLRWLMWCNTRRMAETERQIAQYRRLKADDELKLESLRALLARQQTRQLSLASEQ